ncbi:MAG: DUF2723 domain-containing protein [PVC group bacterium]
MTKMLKWLRFLPVLVFGVAFATYLLTLTPTVDFIDSGELAAVACTLGIAHPTGYPLFTLIGHLFSRLPVGASVIARLNIMSALFAALGTAVFTLLIRTILRVTAEIQEREGRPGAGRGKGKGKKRGGKGRGVGVPDMPLRGELEWLAAGTGGLLLCWSAVFWETGTTLEVYSLHALFTVLLIYLTVRYAAEGNPRRETRLGVIFFFILGLSLANHLTTGLLFPAFFLLLTVKYMSRKTPPGRIVLLMLPALVGILLYLYLPIRAAGRPLVMWGDPTTLRALWDNLTVADFRTRLFAHQSEGETFLDFFIRFPSRTGYVAVPLIFWGMGILFRRSKKYFFFVLAVFIPSILYAATYNVGDNIFYFAPGYIALLIYGGAGAYGLYRAVCRSRRALRVIPVLMIILSLPALFLNYRKADKSNNYFVEDFVHNMFSGIEPDAILFALDCQILLHPLYYYQSVEGFRDDVLVLPNHGLQKGWFADRLRDHHPEIYEKSAGEIENYRSYLERFSKKEVHDGRELDRRYYRMLHSIIERNYERRPIYITSEFNPEPHPAFHPGYYRIPEGLCWRLYRKGDPVREFPYREFTYRELGYPHKDADAVRHAYMYMLNERGTYEASRGNYETALRWVDQALRVYPGEDLLSDRYNGTWVIPNRFREITKTRKEILKRAQEKEGNR